MRRRRGGRWFVGGGDSVGPRFEVIQLSLDKAVQGIKVPCSRA
jgi:hypothetical protein